MLTARRRPRARAEFLAVALLTLLALAHVLAVAPTYGFGSFDDDASYLEIARALAHGAGLTGRLVAGYPLTATYPPGYPALLAPLTVFGAHQVLAGRVLSAALVVVLLPLVHRWLSRLGVGTAVRLGVLALLAANPVLATYGSMVMAELPFLVLFFAWLPCAERYAREETALTGAGWGVAVLGAALLWTKEAAVGLLAGLVLLVLLRRRWAAAGFVTAVTAALVAPLAAVRLAEHSPLLGSRYSTEVGQNLTGGVGTRLHGLGTALHDLVTVALPLAVLPNAHGGPLAGVGWARVAVVPLVAVGAVVAWRRYRTVSVAVLGVYGLEVLAFPYVNERRVVVVLPVVLLWAVLGAVAVARSVARSPSVGRHRAAVALSVLGVAGTAVVLLPQQSRNYLYPVGQHTSRPQGSVYLGLLSGLGRPQDVVETDYLWTTSLLSGHRTANTAYRSGLCDPDFLGEVSADHAGYLLSASLNVLGVGSPCLLDAVSSAPWAVRLMRTADDSAAVFELVGAGTGHPGLTNLLAGIAPSGGGGAPVVWKPEGSQAGEDAGAYPTLPTTNGSATFTWTLPRPATLTQLSVGAAAADDVTGGVDLEVQAIDGAWLRVAGAEQWVGDGSATRYLQAAPPAGPVRAVRVVVRGTGTAEVHDLAVIGAPP